MTQDVIEGGGEPRPGRRRALVVVAVVGLAAAVAVGVVRWRSGVTAERSRLDAARRHLVAELVDGGSDVAHPQVPPTVSKRLSVWVRLENQGREALDIGGVDYAAPGVSLERVLARGVTIGSSYGVAPKDLPTFTLAPTESTKLTLTLAFEGCITDFRPSFTLRLRRHGSDAEFVRRLQQVSAWDGDSDSIPLEQAVAEITCGRWQ